MVTPRLTLDGVVGQAVRRLQDALRAVDRDRAALAARVDALETSHTNVTTLLELGLAIATELAPNTETATGYTYNGAVVYAQRFNGASLTNAAVLLASGVSAILAAVGTCATATDSYHFPVATATHAAGVNSNSNDIVVFATSAFAGNPYDFSVWYTKV